MNFRILQKVKSYYISSMAFPQTMRACNNHKSQVQHESSVLEKRKKHHGLRLKKNFFNKRKKKNNLRRSISQFLQINKHIRYKDEL